MYIRQDLGCVCFNSKPKSENILHSDVCLAPLEWPPIQAPASPNRTTPTAASTLLIPLAQRRQSGRHRPLAHSTPPPNPPDLTTVLHLLQSIHSASTLLLPLTQRRRSGRHQPPAHSTSPLNPLDLAAILHPLRSSLSRSISLFLSLSLEFTFLHSPIYHVNVFILIFGCVKCIF